MGNPDFSAGAMLALLGPLVLLGFVFVPGAWANGNLRLVSRLAVAATVVALVAAIGSAAMLALVGPTRWIWPLGGAFQLGVYFDVLSATILLLVAFLGAIVVRFALTYLRGDTRQGAFLKWLCVTIGAVMMLLVAGNLVMFTAAWVATSLSLNKLLTFYGERAGALISARKKFVISRTGDLCLIGTLILCYRTFGTWEFGELFARARELGASGAPIPASVTLVCFLLVAGAMLKSAQFPFHSWLPDTMETPTPVSALMHAGIINAGGFLVIRMSPIVVLSPVSLHVLAIVGAFTAIFASLVMMTQASIKRQLAFSTIAQMGFMMLQCGLGAFSIATLHIVAHSLYKAHAFLSSGSVVAIARSSWVPTARPAAHPLVMMASLLCAALLTLGAATLLGVSAQSEPGAFVLGAVLMMALTQLLWSLWGQSVSTRLVGMGVLIAGAVGAAYFALHLVSHALLAPALAIPATQLHPLWTATIIGVFAAVLVLQSQLPQWQARPWCRSLYVHARNGFYFNTLFNRAIQAVWPAR